MSTHSNLGPFLNTRTVPLPGGILQALTFELGDPGLRAMLSMLLSGACLFEQQFNLQCSEQKRRAEADDRSLSRTDARAKVTVLLPTTIHSK